MYFKQILVGPMANFAYIFGCPRSKEAAVVDPAFAPEEILRMAEKDGYEIKYLFTTHTHGDHINGHQEVVEKTGAKVVVHKDEARRLKGAGIPVDIEVQDGDEMKVGDVSVKIIHTPGHSPGGICLLLDDEKVITGDTLFVDSCGRDDFAESSPEALYNSLNVTLRGLPDTVEVYPGHDYGGEPSSTIGREKETNWVMRCRTLSDFLAMH